VQATFPTVARKVMISETDRHVIAFGANVIGSTEQDPLLIRFSDQENPADWTPTATNTAGDLRLSQGSEIVTAVRTTRQILVWTDAACIHSFSLLALRLLLVQHCLVTTCELLVPTLLLVSTTWCSGWGRKTSTCSMVVFNRFHVVVRDYVFSDINRNQSFKIYAGSLGITKRGVVVLPICQVLKKTTAMLSITMAKTCGTTVH
jgi:hypothetical protein